MQDRFPVIRLDTPARRSAARDIILGVPNEPAYMMKIVKAESKRSVEQNAKLHAMISEIANSVCWYGNYFDVTTWKRLLTASWLREAGESPQLIPALDGNGFDIIYQKTSKLSQRQCASLIEWVYAFGSEQGVEFKELPASEYDEYPEAQ